MSARGSAIHSQIGGAGTAQVTVTAAGMSGSPRNVVFDVARGDSASAVAGKARTALAADSVVNGFFSVSGSSAAIILTARATAANDATMNIAVANNTCSGLTSAPTSANTTAGVAGTTAQVETATVAGTVAAAAIYLSPATPALMAIASALRAEGIIDATGEYLAGMGQNQLERALAVPSVTQDTLIRGAAVAGL